MKPIVCVVLLFALVIRAQYSPAIPCRNDETCSTILMQPYRAVCINGICMCANATAGRYQYCSNRDIIVNARYGGEQRNCSEDTHCDHIEGAKCYHPSDKTRQGTCDCRPHMVMSTDNHRCLPIVTEPMSRCAESIQCSTGLKGAECVDGICRCRTNFHHSSGKKRCILNKGYGDECTREEESCYQLGGPHNENALGCSDKNICKCRKRFVNVDGICQYSDASRIVVKLLLVAGLAIFTIAVL